MPIKDIANLNLYVRTEGGAIEGRMIDLVPYPMVVLMDGLEILAAMKFSIDQHAWRVENVVATEKYGPTIYKILMEISDDTGISTSPVKGATNQCFIVPKCKKIWNKFDLDIDVRTSFLENGHSEDYLNKKYVCDTFRWDSQVAIENFDKYIEQLVTRKISEKEEAPKFIDKLKSKLGITPSTKQFKDAEEARLEDMKKLTEEIEIALWSKVNRFLGESMKPHR